MDHGARLIRLQGARIRPGTGAPDHNAEEQPSTTGITSASQTAGDRVDGKYDKKRAETEREPMRKLQAPHRNTCSSGASQFTRSGPDGTNILPVCVPGHTAPHSRAPSRPKLRISSPSGLPGCR